MKTVMLNEVPNDQTPLINEDKVMALGYFDGVHAGHQKVIKTAVEKARDQGLKAAVMTFHPHPSVVISHLTPRQDYLTPPEERARLIAGLGADILYIVKFDELFSSRSPQEFVDDYLLKMNVKHMVAGFDFTYGKKAAGTMENIGGFSRAMFDYTVVPKISYRGEKVSTTSIREQIKDGEVRLAAEHLNRPYTISGEVVKGDQRGRTIGFPTANVKADDSYVFPAKGVYAVRLCVQEKWLDGVCNVGTRPTFYNEEQPVTIEVHLFDFSREIYGESVTVAWIEKIRDEVKFDSVDELKAQINKDKELAEQLLSAGN